MKKSTFKYFHHLFSAMIFIPEDEDKDELVNREFQDYKASDYEDPVAFLYSSFDRMTEEEHSMYVRKTFKIPEDAN